MRLRVVLAICTLSAAPGCGSGEVPELGDSSTQGDTGDGDGDTGSPGDGDSANGDGDVGDGDGGNDDGGDGDGDGLACDGTVHSGDATYYAADGSGNCSFPATPDDLMVAAMNQTDYGGSDACGTCVSIDGPDGTVTVRIVDRCPECAQGNIDLSFEAFSQVANPADGVVPIEWSYVPCPVTGPVIYHFKEGSSQWWTAIQLRNHRHEIAGLEYRFEDSWLEMVRGNDNYFVSSEGVGPGPIELRVTDVYGQVLIDGDVPVLDNAEAAGAAQFPTCE